MANERRSTRPMFAGPAINNFLRRLGAKASDGDLAAKWGDIVGEDSELVKISRGVSGRTATIRAKNPAARLAMSYQAPEIIEKINAYFGYDAVLKIVVK
ncbi:MAG: DUF721 domain-containing protein [Rickettsiales bacterium]|jgi:hypothetical protein|nr:DUF721 domain-containing protein [Rickettsiales bacterium]